MTAEFILQFTVSGVAWPTFLTLAGRHLERRFYHRNVSGLLADLALLGALIAVGDLMFHAPHAAALGSAALAVVAFIAWWWKRRRPDKAARQLGGKALARLEAMLGKLRDVAQPGPRPAWEGAS